MAMRSNQILLQAEMCKNGLPVLKGQPHSTFFSTAEIIVVATVSATVTQKSIAQANTELKKSIRGNLPKGTFGAFLNSNGMQTVEEKVLFDSCIEIRGDEHVDLVNKVVNELKRVGAKLKHTVPGRGELTTEELRSQLPEDSNREIRKQIDAVKKQYRHKAGDKMPKDLLEQIERLYQGIVHMTGIELRLDFYVKHTVNTSGMYVKDTTTKEQHQALHDGAKQHYRPLKGRYQGNLKRTIRVPISKVEHLQAIASEVKFAVQFNREDPLIHTLREGIHEDAKFWTALRDKDRQSYVIHSNSKALQMNLNR